MKKIYIFGEEKSQPLIAMLIIHISIFGMIFTQVRNTATNKMVKILKILKISVNNSN